jgi:hypothetical protein
MIFVLNINAQSFELFDESLDLILSRVASHVPKIFEFRPTQYFVNHSGQPIGNGHFGFVG